MGCKWQLHCLVGMFSLNSLGIVLLVVTLFTAVLLTLSLSVSPSLCLSLSLSALSPSLSSSSSSGHYW